MKTTILLIYIAIISIQTSLCQVVSEWRGLGRTGIYNETDLLKKWPENGPKLLWSATDLPKGNSSASIGNNTIYLTGMKDNMDLLIALDMNGVIKWQTPYGRAWDKSFPESRSTPTVEKDRIYVSSGFGDVACIDANNGKIFWTVETNEKFGGTTGRWGIAESLLVFDNKVFFTAGGNKTTTVALNKLTGETLWMTEGLMDNPSYSSPILIEKSGKMQLISVAEKNILGISPADGKIEWKFDFGIYCQENRNNHATTPLYYNNQIFVSSGYDHKSVMLNLSDNLSSVSIAWVDSVLDNHLGGVLRVGDYIYGSNWLNNSMGRWVCLNWKSGKVQYDTTWINKGTIIYAEGNLYCYEEKTGNVALVKAIPEKFEITSSFKVPLGAGPHWAHPVISNGILYIRHSNTLMAYDIKNTNNKMPGFITFEVD